MSGEITLARELYGLGYSPNELARMVRSGELRHVRRGAYLWSGSAVSGELTARERYRRVIEATVAGCSPDAVVSDMSAACLHQLPIWIQPASRVHLNRDRSGGRTARRFVEIRGLPLPAEDVVSVDGMAVISLARTVLDLACRLPLEQAVAVGDAALRRGLDADELHRVLERSAGRHGIGAARRALALLDGRSESVGESRSRVLFHRSGLPTPVPQFEVLDADGHFLARVDFGWPELRTVGEFDGRIKYQRALRPGHDPEAELFREKRREDAIRALDLQVVRWVNDDLSAPDDLLVRLRQAFERGRRSR